MEAPSAAPVDAIAIGRLNRDQLVYGSKPNLAGISPLSGLYSVVSFNLSAAYAMKLITEDKFTEMQEADHSDVSLFVKNRTPIGDGHLKLSEYYTSRDTHKVRGGSPVYYYSRPSPPTFGSTRLSSAVIYLLIDLSNPPPSSPATMKDANTIFNAKSAPNARQLLVNHLKLGIYLAHFNYGIGMVSEDIKERKDTLEDCGSLVKLLKLGDPLSVGQLESHLFRFHELIDEPSYEFYASSGELQTDAANNELLLSFLLIGVEVPVFSGSRYKINFSPPFEHKFSIPYGPFQVLRKNVAPFPRTDGESNENFVKRYHAVTQTNVLEPWHQILSKEAVDKMMIFSSLIKHGPLTAVKNAGPGEPAYEVNPNIKKLEAWKIAVAVLEKVSIPSPGKNVTLRECFLPPLSPPGRTT